MRTIAFVVAGFAFSVIAGCTSGPSPAEQIERLKQEKKQLQGGLERSKSENRQLREQVQTLSGLKPEVKLENLYNLQKIRLTRYTDFYDKDKNGKKEKLIVYIQPIDEQDNVIKASGTVEVQLWDLSKKENEAMLAQWTVKPDELKKLWFESFLTISYRLTFDVADLIKGINEPLTVRVVFTDYLAGKVFKEQKVIKL